MTKSIERNYKIDYLRAIGTFLVILAHTNPPELLKNIRCFDVCLLFLISGMSFVLSNRADYNKNYLWKRIKKLVFPAYLVMGLLFFGTTVLCLIVGTEPMYTVKDFFYTFLLTNKGIGYVWIVKIYVFSALLSPMISNFSKNSTNQKFNLTILSVMAGYAVLYYSYIKLLKGLCNEFFSIVFEEYVLAIIGYMIVVAIGIRIIKFPDYWKSALAISAIIFTIAQIQIIIDGESFVPNSYKFPPSLYYITYGLIISIILYKIIPNVKSNIIIWISKHSYDIYLLHIPFIIFIMILRSDSINFAPQLMNAWYFKYIILIFGSVIATIVWNYLNKITISKIKK